MCGAGSVPTINMKASFSRETPLKRDPCAVCVSRKCEHGQGYLNGVDPERYFDVGILSTFCEIAHISQMKVETKRFKLFICHESERSLRICSPRIVQTYYL